MAKTKSTSAPRAPKAPANYVKLAADTELVLDGLTARCEKTAAHLAELLADVPHSEAIMQSFRHLANWEAQRYEVQARYERYVSLRDRDGLSDMPTEA